MNEPGLLDAVGVRHGSALSSLGRDRLRAWEPLLGILPRDAAFDLLEIGAGAGASLRTWREWFPVARLVGLDVRRIALDPPIAGCTLVQGSQTDLRVLQPLLRDHRFRLIVDDGSGQAADQVHTFLTLFPWLEPASVYICANLDLAHDDPDDERGADNDNDHADADHAVAKTDRLREASAEAWPDDQSMAWRRPLHATDWFANLGARVARGDRHERKAAPPSPIDQALQHATAVALFRGSVVVTS